MEKLQRESPGVFAPPLLLYIGWLLAGWGIHQAMPLSLFFSGIPVKVAGVVLILLGAAVVYWSFHTMRLIGTSVNPYKAAQALATDGPYRFSRNPIYVALTGAYIGTSLLMGSIWPLILLPILMAVMHRGVICREERHLEKNFGAAYQAYKEKVGRWF